MKSSMSASHSGSIGMPLPLPQDPQELTEMWSRFGEVGVQMAHASAELSKVWMDTSMEVQTSLWRMLSDQAQILNPPDEERAAWPGAGD